MWTPNILLGHTILTSRNVVSTTTTMGHATSGLFLLSTNQTSNPLIVTQPMTIQVGTTSVLLRGGNNIGLGPNPLNLGKTPTMGSNPTMGPTPMMSQPPTMVQNFNMGPNPIIGQNPTLSQNTTMLQNPIIG